MATKGRQTKKVESWKYFLGIGAVALLAYFYLGGDDAPTASKTAAPPPVAKVAGPADAYVKADYTANYPALKVTAKDAFLPLVRKAPAGEADKGLPSSITGGGSWSYDGSVSVDNKVQGLLDETKTGESDYVSVGEHWKHGRIKRITDSEIILAGDDGTMATMKMGVPSDAAEKKGVVASDNTNQPAPLAGQIGPLDITPLPDPNQFGNNPGGNNRRNRGFGGGGRGGRGGRGGFGGGGGGFGFGGG